MLSHIFLFACEKAHSIQELVLSKTLGYSISSFYWMSTHWITLQHRMKKVYHKYDIVKAMVDSISSVYSQINRMSVTHLTETDSSGYFCLCSYHLSINHPDSTDTCKEEEYIYNYNEKYEYFESKNIVTDEDMHDSVNKYYEYVDRHRKIIENVYHSMCIYKYDNKYIVRDYPLLISETEITYQPSTARFMVEYTHPKQKNQITLMIPKSMYMVGNHLLSFIFVLRLLKYQPESFHFDMDYQLKIIDEDINMFVLNSSQFIHLTENGYQIMERNK